MMNFRLLLLICAAALGRCVVDAKAGATIDYMRRDANAEQFSKSSDADGGWDDSASIDYARGRVTAAQSSVLDPSGHFYGTGTVTTSAPTSTSSRFFSASTSMTVDFVLDASYHYTIEANQIFDLIPPGVVANGEISLYSFTDGAYVEVLNGAGLLRNSGTLNAGEYEFLVYTRAHSDVAIDLPTSTAWEVDFQFTPIVNSVPGDTDGDGQVGLDDLNNVRNHFGATGEPGLPGDAIPFDGLVDLTDLNAVRNHFGAVSATSVPEPPAGLMLAGGCLAIGVWCSVGALRWASPFFGGRKEQSVRILNVVSPCLVAFAFLLATAVASRADIYRWDNGQLIPGTEGITPGPGVQLDHRELEFASLDGRNLSNTSFDSSNLNSARLDSSNLTNTDLSDAVVTNAWFGDTTSRGFTKEQLYSTASYQAKNLTGIGLYLNDLRAWDFHEQNMTNVLVADSDVTNATFSGAVVSWASFSSSTTLIKEQIYSTASYQAKNLTGIGLAFNNLSGWDFHSQNLTNANLHTATLTNANFNGAVVSGAMFRDARGFTKEQLYSTASYQSKNLQDIGLAEIDLSGWNLKGQDLANASLYFSKFTNADLSGAVVTGARFDDTTSRGFIRAQLYSTASYQAKNLQGIGLDGNDLIGWDFSGQDLANAVLRNTKLTSANLTGAVVKGADFHGTGISQEQLYSTASYQQKNLSGINLESNDLSGWDFHGQNLANARLFSSKLTNANLSGAVVTGTDLSFATWGGFTKEQLYSTASYQAKDLSGIALTSNNLSGWDFQGQNLSNANLYFAILTNANLTGADTRGAQYVDLTGAIQRNAILSGGTIAGLALNSGDRLVVRDYHEAPNVPDQLPIPVTIHDGLTLANGGVLQLLFDADHWDSTISFQPGIPVSLGGSLELAFADGVLAAEHAGHTFDLFDWTGVSPTGAFTIDSDYFWDLSQLYTSGDVTLLSALTGDTDGDGQVGLDDLNNVRNHFGETGALGLPGDSIPLDGIVDLTDLNAVRNHFGAATTQPVPEPSTIVLTACGLAALVASRVRRRNHRYLRIRTLWRYSRLARPDCLRKRLIPWRLDHNPPAPPLASIVTDNNSDAIAFDDSRFAFDVSTVDFSLRTTTSTNWTCKTPWQPQPDGLFLPALQLVEQVYFG